MSNPEPATCRATWLGPRLRRAALIGVCVLGLGIVRPRSSDAQSPPPAPPSEREAERQRLLDQLGLKKRAAPPKGANDEANPEKDEERKKETGAEPPAAEGGAAADPEAPPGRVFSGKLHRALLGACRSCHGAGGVAGQSAYVLDGTLDADFAATRRHVKAGQPEQSPLLRLALGAGHAGGAIFAPGSPQQQLLSSWIGDGAKRGGLAAGAAGAVAPASGATQPDARLIPPPPAAPAPPSAPSSAAASVVPVAAASGTSSVPGHAYAPTLHDALNQACAGCHRFGALAGNTGYVLRGEVAADFASARRFVDLEQPEQSPLLRKASGVTHAGGAVYPPESAAYLLLLEWIRLGAPGPTDAPPVAVASEPTTAAASPPVAARAIAAPAGSPTAPHGAAAPAHGKGLSLPYDFRLNGRFDLNYERRNFDTQPFSSGDNAIQSYHHFVFLSRQSKDDPVAFSVELINLSFWEVNYRLSLPESAGQLWIKAGKLLVPFGPDPLFHQSYGGLAGFDQRVLPVIWAEEGLSGRFWLEQGDFAGSADVYVVRGYELKQRDAVLNLQSDLSPLDSVQVAFGARLRASWKAVSLFYSAMGNGLGFGRVLYLQAVDVEVWRLRGVPVLEHLAGEVGLMRADVSGAGAGQDYYHFASYFRLRYYLTDLAYLQYRQGLRTFDNRRGVILDDTRLTREDGSTHNFGLVARRGPLTFGLYYYFILEKADEVDDDFLRVTAVYEF